VTAMPPDRAERLGPARGILTGPLIAVPFWLLLAALVWFYR